MASNDHTIYVREGVVGSPAEANKNPSVAANQDSKSGQSPFGTAVKATVLIQGAKQVMNRGIGEIGFITGDYQLQETAEAITGIGAGLIGLFAAPVPTAVALGVTTGFSIFKTGVTQNREIFKQQQAQVLTGKISVNGGRN